MRKLLVELEFTHLAKKGRAMIGASYLQKKYDTSCARRAFGYIYTFDEAETVKIGTDGKVKECVLILFFVGYALDRSGDIYHMFNPKMRGDVAKGHV